MRMSRAETEEIVSRYREGFAIARIALRMNRSQKTVISILKRSGVRIPKDRLPFRMKPSDLKRRRCPICKKRFIRKTARQVFCSKECASIGNMSSRS